MVSLAVVLRNLLDSKKLRQTKRWSSNLAAAFAGQSTIAKVYSLGSAVLPEKSEQCLAAVEVVSVSAGHHT